MEYLALAEANVAQRMAARVAELDAQVTSSATLTAQRAALKSGSRKLNTYLRGLTDTQLKNNLGLTDFELAVMKAYYKDLT